MKTITSMNEAWGAVGKTLFIEGEEWGVITDVRAKYGVDIQWIVSGIRFVNVTEEKIFNRMFEIA